MQVRWSPEAAEDLERIVEYIYRENPSAGQRVAQLIYERAGALKTLPYRGRPGRIKGQASYLAIVAIHLDLQGTR